MTASWTVCFCCVTRRTLVVVGPLAAVVSQVESGLDAGQCLLGLLAVPARAPLPVHVVHREHLQTSIVSACVVLVGPASRDGVRRRRRGSPRPGVEALPRTRVTRVDGDGPGSGTVVLLHSPAEVLRKTGTVGALPTPAARWPYCEASPRRSIST